MSSAIHAIGGFVASAGPNRQSVHASLPVPTVSSIPAGTFAPGTKVQVGGHRVIIEKYLSEGGFAHVYLVRLPKAVNNEDAAVLKRVAVPDKEALASMRTEVETMKKLQGYRHIVTYIDSHASQLKGGGYEVFLLMEYCAGGGLIDFMNTRLQSRLTEPEILKIISDVAQGVACMHYLSPPLLHRDLKVENVLISTSKSLRQFKVCDFGSTASPRAAATTAAQGRLIEEDVQKHTTLQYRSPEMIDVYRKQPIDEKSDIWALGVLLYKLCYYTTPFEEQGQMAILNASFKFPRYPLFSDGIKSLIASMLQEKPHLRPNIYQVVRDVCLMRGTDIPIKDIYADRKASEARRSQQLPLPPSQALSPPLVGAYMAAPVDEEPVLPDIIPMRRGRPKSSSAEHSAPRPSPSPMRVKVGDPFTALDSSSGSAHNVSLKEDVSSRFPPLNQFSILHETGAKFAFDENPSPSTTLPKDLNQRVTEALADDAFALSTTSKTDSLTRIGSMAAPASSKPDNVTSSSRQTSLKSTEIPPTQVQVTPSPVMVSTGTMTSPPLQVSEGTQATHSPQPIFKFPQTRDPRSSSQPRVADRPPPSNDSSFGMDRTSPLRPALLEHRSKSQTTTLGLTKMPASSLLSLEDRRPSPTDLDKTINRSRSTNARNRPSSAHIELTRSTPHSRSPSRAMTSTESRYLVPQQGGKEIPEWNGSSDFGHDQTKITSNVEFLRAMEEEDPHKRKPKRNSSGSKHTKRSSLPSISLSGTKSLLSGRFGDAFRRFEINTSSSNQRDTSPLDDHRDSVLTPITGSEATDGRSDDGQVVEETEETPAEVRREIERRRLSLEERRVADAAAAYKQRLASRGNDASSIVRGGETNRAALIQNKVQSLLDEGCKSPTKTAEGYGRFTDPLHHRIPDRRSDEATTISGTTGTQLGGPSVSGARPSSSWNRVPPPSSSIIAPADRSFPLRPSAPPKPKALRTGTRSEPVDPSAALLPSTVAASDIAGRSSDGGSRVGSQDWEATFSKKYLSLSGLEMVETEIDKGSAAVGVEARDG